MKITKLTKEINIGEDTARYAVEITAGRPKGYTKLDVFPDEMLGDLLVALGRELGLTPLTLGRRVESRGIRI